MTWRPAAVAGRFYPAEPGELQALVQECLAGVPAERTAARAALVPHAGLVYSGRCAGAVLGRLALPRLLVILAPNHTGCCTSPGASLWPEGAFETPLGPVPVARAFGARLTERCELVAPDPLAHAAEHAIEVELPFVRLLAPGAEIVPLVLAWDDWPRCRRLAAALAELVAEWPEPALILASSDMTHYEPAARAAAKDRLALDAVARLDGEGLLRLCHQQGISMCGRAPAAVAIEAARRLGATASRIVDYRHSGLVTGDDRQVVAYAGVIAA
jgi:hypothetical protein